MPMHIYTYTHKHIHIHTTYKLMHSKVVSVDLSYVTFETAKKDKILMPTSSVYGKSVQMVSDENWNIDLNQS